MNAAPKRPWFQFSLRSMFVAMTAWALVLPIIPPVVAKCRAWWGERDRIEFGGTGTIDPLPPICCYWAQDADVKAPDQDDAAFDEPNDNDQSE